MDRHCSGRAVSDSGCTSTPLKAGLSSAGLVFFVLLSLVFLPNMVRWSECALCERQRASRVDARAPTGNTVPEFRCYPDRARSSRLVHTGGIE